MRHGKTAGSARHCFPCATRSRGAAKPGAKLPDVLISYAGADRKRAQALAQGLEAEGFSVALEANAALRLSAHRTLAESGCVLVLWSKASLREDSATLDAAQAFNQGKLLGARLQDVEPPYPFSLLGALDLTDWRGGRDEPHWRDVAHNVRAIVADDRDGHVVLAPPPAPPPPPPPPPPRAVAPAPNIFQTPPRRPEPAPAPPPVLAREEPARLDEPRQLRRPAQHVEETKPEGEGSRIAPIVIAAMALIAAGIWGGPRVIDMLNSRNGPAQQGVQETAPAEPPEFARVQPATEAPPTPEPAVADGPLEAVVALPPTAPVEPKPDPATTLASLEKCLAALAKQCGRLDPPIAQSFKTDGALSAGEKRLLGSAIFPDKALVTVRNVDACLATKAPAQVARACPSIAAKVEPPVTSVRPAIPPAIKTPEEPPKPIVEPAPGVSLSDPKPVSQPEL